MEDNFENEWLKARRQVLAYCARSTGNQAEAEDIFQRVAIRAWRGYSNFRADSSFLTWALAIARREVARAMSRVKMEDSLDELAEKGPANMPIATAPEGTGPAYNWLAEAAQAALAAGVLTDIEAGVVIDRLAFQDLSWEELGKKFHTDGTGCAVIHCRAIPKLRVFLFIYRPAILGGIRSISQAFAAASADEKNPLSKDEAEVFRRIVLDGQKSYRRTGLRPLLRSACAKVIKWLSLP